MVLHHGGYIGTGAISQVFQIMTATGYPVNRMILMHYGMQGPAQTIQTIYISLLLVK